MSLTLSLLASVLVLLPGLAGLAAFNNRTRGGGARRPELPLTTVTALVVAAFVSILSHLAAWMIAQGAIDLVVAVNDRFPVFDFGPVIANPLSAFFDAIAESKAMTFPTALGLCVVLLCEIAAVVEFVQGDTFELAFDHVDFNGQGWVFEHITRPAENGYTPVGHVFPSTMSGRYGIAYKGPIIDIRQGDKGEIGAIALSRPERFLYELGSFETAHRKRAWLGRLFSAPEERSRVESGVAHHDKDYAGGVVALDARVISNIVVHSVSNSLLAQIDETLPDVSEDVLS